MYERFYGLTLRPFELTPDSRFLFLTARHREALAHLEYGLCGRKGITLLVGEVGTGKTTLLRAALTSLQKLGVHYVHLSNPILTRAEFFAALSQGFGLSPAAAESKVTLLSELEALIHKVHANNGVAALIVDEAQALPLEILEEIRLLANFETETEKLLQVVLVGQPELGDRLNEPSLRQLKQRIALRTTLTAMDLSETAAYVAGRIRIAGGDAVSLFSREAIIEIFNRSGGIPRLVSVICDNALVTGFAAGVRPVDRRIVVEVCTDFDLHGANPGRKPPSGPVDQVSDRSNGRPEVAGRESSEVEADDNSEKAQNRDGRVLFGGRSGRH
jgi:general secretion pathway protein A